MPEQAAQLVFGRDHGDLGVRGGKGGENSAAAQVLGVIHHHFGAGFAIPKVVAADAVHRRRHAGDDR